MPALSSVTQSLGYLIAAAGPFSFGGLHDATGGWTWPLVVLTLLVLPLFALAAYVARPAANRATEMRRYSGPPSR